MYYEKFVNPLCSKVILVINLTQALYLYTLWVNLYENTRYLCRMLHRYNYDNNNYNILLKFKI
jgi:hypothetical protein